jgi:uncharacterized protein YcaQ
MKITRFEDIDAWKEARELAQRIYQVSETGKLANITRQEFDCLYQMAIKVKNLISGFIRYLRGNRHPQT